MLQISDKSTLVIILFDIGLLLLRPDTDDTSTIWMDVSKLHFSKSYLIYINDIRWSSRFAFAKPEHDQFPGWVLPHTRSNVPH